MNENVNIASIKKKTRKRGDATSKAPKPNPEMLLEGNQKLNQIKKLEFKKNKKMQRRKEEVALQLTAGLENVTLKSNEKVDDYNFDTDFNMPL